MIQKRNDLKEFKDKLELFYNDTVEIKSNNEHKIKDLEERKIVLNTALELYDKVLNIYKLKMTNLQKLRRKG